MYLVDGQDSVVELTDIPQSSVGAPLPSLIVTEIELFLLFYLENTPDHWDGSNVRVLGPDSTGEPVAIVSFDGCYAHMFGPPNDEAFEGHPLAGRGLHPYGAFIVKNSSWLRSLEQMNSVHPYHSSERFNSFIHFIFAFHDSTFECIARSYKIETTVASTKQALSDVAGRLR